MSLRNLFRKEPAVVRFSQAGRGLTIYRYGSDSRDYPLLPGTRIEVEAGQFIAFLQNGELIDTWDEGSYILGPEMFPGLAEKGAFRGWRMRPVQAELYYLDLTRVTDKKWATRTPVLKEENGQLYQIRAFGKMAYRIRDGIGFMLEAFLNRHLETSFDVNQYVSSITAGAFAAVVAEQNLRVTDIINHYSALSDMVMLRANETAKQLGLEVTGVLIEGASLPM